MNIERHDPSGHLSKAVEHNGVVYVAGLTATNKSLGMKQQTEEVLKKIDGYLEACGTNNRHTMARHPAASSVPNVQTGQTSRNNPSARRRASRCRGTRVMNSIRRRIGGKWRRADDSRIQAGVRGPVRRHNVPTERRCGTMPAP